MLDSQTTLKALQTGEIQLQGQFLNSSNYTFLVTVLYQEQSLRVVYKPIRGERPLWDFPQRTLTKREVAAYVVSEALGWELVPPTVFRRRKAPLGAGSLQLFVEHDPEYFYFRFTEDDKQRLRPVVLFDLLINNADRKGGHILCDVDQHIWLIDHGVCFHEEDKLRSVVWDFVDEDIPAYLLVDLEKLIGDIENQGDCYEKLKPLLNPAEIKALEARARRLVDKAKFPPPNAGRRSYPWPPI